MSRFGDKARTQRRKQVASERRFMKAWRAWKKKHPGLNPEPDFHFATRGEPEYLMMHAERAVPSFPLDPFWQLEEIFTYVPLHKIQHRGIGTHWRTFNRFRASNDNDLQNLRREVR